MIPGIVVLHCVVRFVYLTALIGCFVCCWFAGAMFLILLPILRLWIVDFILRFLEASTEWMELN
jgi:hypothetical protein